MVEQISRDILSRSKTKDLAAFQKLVEYYQTYAFTLAFRLICNEDDAKDIVQESFIRIWKHIADYDFSIKFSTWLYKIVTNLCFDHLKSKKRRNSISIDVVKNASLNFLFDKDLEENLVNQNLVKVIESIANGLNEKQRIVFILRDLQELEMDEIAEIMNMSAGQIKSNLYYARQNIRLQLENMNLLN
jgi:RNA polymerase sigma-70 factor, ECF subfamily